MLTFRTFLYIEFTASRSHTLTGRPQILGHSVQDYFQQDWAELCQAQNIHCRLDHQYRRHTFTPT